MNETERTEPEITTVSQEAIDELQANYKRSQERFKNEILADVQKLIDKNNDALKLEIEELLIELHS